MSTRCPLCDGGSIVKDSRPKTNECIIKRRRECYRCGWRWNTYEVGIEYIETFKEVKKSLKSLSRHGHSPLLQNCVSLMDDINLEV
jgi:transcriptional regulator NrdR family protein